MRPLTQAQWMRENLGWFVGCAATCKCAELLAGWLIKVGWLARGSQVAATLLLLLMLISHGVLWWQVRRGNYLTSTPASVWVGLAALIWHMLLYGFQILCTVLLVLFLLFALGLALGPNTGLGF